MDNKDDLNIQMLYKMLQNACAEIQRLHDKNVALEEEIRALRASIAIMQGLEVTDKAKSHIAKNDMKKGTAAINYFDTLTNTFGNSLNESDTMNRQR